MGTDAEGFELFLHRQDLGELEEIVSLDGIAFYVLDARHWSYGTRKLLPIEAIDRLDEVQRRAFTRYGLDQIRNSPDFNPFLLRSPEYSERVIAYYRTVRCP